MEQGWCQECNTHTKDGEMAQFKEGNGNWYFLCQKCKKEYGKY